MPSTLRKIKSWGPRSVLLAWIPKKKQWQQNLGCTLIFYFFLTLLITLYSNHLLYFGFHLLNRLATWYLCCWLFKSNPGAKCINWLLDRLRPLQAKQVVRWCLHYPVGYFLIWQPCNFVWASAPNVPTPSTAWPLRLMDQDSRLSSLQMHRSWDRLVSLIKLLWGQLHC
jgi:hypothetical protein